LSLANVTILPYKAAQKRIKLVLCLLFFLFLRLFEPVLVKFDHSNERYTSYDPDLAVMHGGLPATVSGLLSAHLFTQPL
jgi:hypothetical protein